MRKWIIIVLAVQAILIAELATVMYFAPIQLEWISSTSVLSAPATIEHTTEDIAWDFEPMTKEDWQEFERRWVIAPEEIRELARRIAEGASLNAKELQTIGKEALSRGYQVPELDFTHNGTPVPYLATLLQEATLAYNLDAMHALLAAGTDPNVNNCEALFIAIEQKTRGAPAFMLFPDHNEMLPFLRTYLEAGANPNAQKYGFKSETLIHSAYLQQNLGAMLLMLQFGANPWLKFPDKEGFVGDSTLEGLAFGSANGATAETLFRLARSGYLPQGPAELETEIFLRLSETAKDFASGTGPASRHTAWRLDQLLQVLGPTLDREEEANAIRQQLTSFDYQADGGWYLAEGEVHSRYDAPLSVPDKGTEIWGP